MIENPYPEDWRDLQKGVCSILNEIGLNAEEGKILKTPRGSIELDIYAIDEKSVDKIKYVVECKNWTSSIPQSVVHSFTTVMHEIGANIGYIISKHGLQSGAKEYIRNTNILGLTYEEFQKRYFSIWYEKCFVTKIGDVVDPLAQYVEPFNSFRDQRIAQLSEIKRKEFSELIKKYYNFGSAMSFFEFPRYSPHFGMPAPENINDLKRKIVSTLGKDYEFRADYYRELLNQIRSKVIEVTKEFNAIFGKNIFEDR